MYNKIEGRGEGFNQILFNFRLPKRIQADQDSNFMTKTFAQVMSMLSVKHQVSSAFHPESQGALERFYQTRKFCVGTNRKWDEGLPLLPFAIRETAWFQPLGFSLAELVFGHTLRGPLRLLQQSWLADKRSPAHYMLDYVSTFRERLHTACDLARTSVLHSLK